MVAMQGKFTFPAPVALKTTETKKNAEGADVPIDQADISLINLQNVRFSYDVKTGHFIFNDPISFNVKSSTRVGVMGPNGAGKSTFLKLLTYKLKPVDGTVTQHPDFTLAYFGQHSTAELDLELTPIEFMMREFPNETKAGALRSHLGKTGITGQTADTRMKGLSFSQRSCIVFAKLTYICPHLLIMDEPTNFLDLESVDSLIQACNKYKGALLLVSHNRDFLKKCAKQYLSIVPGHFNVYDTLKVAEKATYTFIDEMESGNTSGIGKDALANNPGGGTVHATQKVSATPAPATTATTTSAPVSPTPSPSQSPLPSPTPSPLPSPREGSSTIPIDADKSEKIDFAVGEKVKALWSDGKFYNATIKKIENAKFIVHYTEYGNTAPVPLSSLQKITQQQKGNNQQNNNRPPNKNKNTR
jgi:ABC-type Mn2+/Zn2+ transport system ATPase subunit